MCGSVAGSSCEDAQRVLTVGSAKAVEPSDYCADLSYRPCGQDEMQKSVVPSEWDAERFRFISVLRQAPRNRGRIELVEDTATKQLLAVKAMPLSWACDGHQEFIDNYPEERERPWCDIQTTRLLNQQNFDFVCDFAGVFRRRSEDGMEEICMVLSYCSGGDLFSWMERKVAGACMQRENVSRFVIKSVFTAVKRLHEEGIAHGDLSLENVMFASNFDLSGVPDVRLIDFAASSGASASGVRGKPSYHAPEMFTGEEYDARKADAFSLGVMLFTLLVGNYPWLSTRPGRCSCYRYFARHGLRKYLAERRYEVNGEKFPLLLHMSDKAVGLLSGLLSVDPKQRPTVEEALEHAWFAELDLSPTPQTVSFQRQASDESVSGDVCSAGFSKIIRKVSHLLWAI